MVFVGQITCPTINNLQSTDKLSDSYDNLTDGRGIFSLASAIEIAQVM